MQGTRPANLLIATRVGPFASTAIDPVTRRKVRFIETTVPALFLAETNPGLYLPADRYYVDLGSASGSATLALWAGSATSVTFQNWDATEHRNYARLSNAGSAFILGSTSVMHWGGPFGEATSYAPKNADVTKCVIQFRARFNANADYATYGVGAGDNAGGGGRFNNTGDRFIQVDRNSGSWELGTCDGTTISQSSGGSADGNWHDFRIEWIETAVALYVDGVLTVTKSTNLPDRPLKLIMQAQNTTNTIDIFDYLVMWE